LEKCWKFPVDVKCKPSESYATFFQESGDGGKKKLGDWHISEGIMKWILKETTILLLTGYIWHPVGSI
jgi:hypothetical protein